MLDVTELVLEDHHTLRLRFAGLDDAEDMDDAVRKGALTVLWKDLATLLEVHAQCEEEVFYPQLLKKQTADGEDEAEDAIDDHNKIREAVRKANRHEVDSDGWWAAVGEARTENSKHIAEEEREALPDFRHASTLEQRQQLAVAWTKWRSEHQLPRGIDDEDKDAAKYIEANS
ncbi:MAG TPA: hemerythrin domain-containing protein [Frankiaceae bacterium]|nr:hemerythrin domain-containing protein [Frankiaceae bacterium]